MEALTAVLSFSTIVQLIGVFRAERKTTKDDEYEQFLGWLQTRRHDELVNLLATDIQVGDAIKGLLQGNQEELLTRIAGLETVLSEIATKVDVFQPLAKAVGIEAPLSEQARSVLAQMNQSEASKFLECKTLQSTDYMYLDGNRAQARTLTMSDPRFAEDDFNILLELGLLRLDYNGKGDRIFHITRLGAEVGGK